MPLWGASWMQAATERANAEYAAESAAPAAPARTVIDMRELPGGPRAAPLDARWPQPLAPGARETAYDMEYAEVEEGQVMESDLAIMRNVTDFLKRAGPVPVRRDYSDWACDLLDLSTLPDLSETAVSTGDEVRFVAQGSHSMGRGNGGNRAARSSWARL